MLQSRKSESRESKVFTGSRSQSRKIYARLPVLHKNLTKMYATSCVNVTVVKLHVALARISVAATVYAYIYIFTFLNSFGFSLLRCCRVGFEGVEGFYRGRSQSRSRKKDFAGVGSQSRTGINPGSRSWSQTEKMAKSRSRADFASTLQP